MNKAQIKLIATALRDARGTGYILPDEKNMWEICVSNIIEALSHLPNFDRVPFQIACGCTPTIRIEP